MVKADDEKTEKDLEVDEHQIGLSDDFIRDVSELLEKNEAEKIREACRDLSPPDTAELITKSRPDERSRLIEVLETQINPETFSYFDRDTLNSLLEHMSGTYIAWIVNELDSDDAINLINDLDEDRRSDIMRSVSRNVRAVVEEGLTFPERSAGRLMQREFVAVPQFWTVGKAIDYLRAASALPDKFYDIFIVDPTHRFVGEVTLSSILCAPRTTKVDALMQDQRVTVPVDMPQEQVAHLFRRKDLLSAPVVDDDNRMIGVITVDDIVDVIDREAEEDFLKIGGVFNSDIFRPMLSTARARFWWLAINLGTAFLDTAVISMFEHTIEKVVALAALMPVVASMGGNAGTQTLTVVVRALATKELTAANAWRMVGKELMVGLFNGVIFAAIMVGIVVVWYHDLRLGLIMGAAMIFNLVAAGLSGALIPMALDRVGFDPAHSGAVFLTTVTDVVGFFAFLGLAAMFLI